MPGSPPLPRHPWSAVVDAKNRFETKVTFRLSRLEWLTALVISLVLAYRHLTDIRWPVFAGLFAGIDAIGYLPGAIAFRRSSDGRIGRGYYVAYNLMHSLVTATAIAAGWALLVKPEWALLALPIHLMGDRALFGNSLKPFGISFEPEKHPAYTEFERHYRTAPTGARRDLAEGADAVRA
nr:hypothetical protein [Streptomyces sp. SID5468]